MNTESTMPAGSPASGSTPSTIVIRQSEGGKLWRFVAFVGWAAFLAAALFAVAQFVSLHAYFDNSQGITEKYHSHEKFATSKVAIITVEGLIADPEGFVKGQIDRVREDTDVKAVVVRIDSPGGTVTASDYLWHHLTRLREDRKLPIVVSMGGIAASGGYYIAMAVGDQPQSIYAEPTTTTGSIGVMFPHYDFSGLLARWDVKDDSLVTHPRKEMASMTKPMPDEHRALLQGYIDESFDRFKKVVLSGRPKFRDAPDRLDKLATGEIFSATKARQAGLVDEIGFIEDAVTRAIKLTGLPEDEVRVVRYEHPVSLFDLGVMARTSAAFGSRARPGPWLELATPRAWYLSSTLPPLMSSYSNLLRQ